MPTLDNACVRLFFAVASSKPGTEVRNETVAEQRTVFSAPIALDKSEVGNAVGFASKAFNLSYSARPVVAKARASSRSARTLEASLRATTNCREASSAWRVASDIFFCISSTCFFESRAEVSAASTLVATSVKLATARARSRSLSASVAQFTIQVRSTPAPKPRVSITRIRPTERVFLAACVCGFSDGAPSLHGL